MIPTMDDEQRIQHLEEVISYLENHVAEQDKEMLKLQQKTDLLIKELKKLHARIEEEDDGEDLPFEKPPHY